MAPQNERGDPHLRETFKQNWGGKYHNFIKKVDLT